MTFSRKQYEKFLDLWKNANPGVAEVEAGWAEEYVIFYRSDLNSH